MLGHKMWGLHGRPINKVSIYCVYCLVNTNIDWLMLLFMALYEKSSSLFGTQVVVFVSAIGLAREAISPHYIYQLVCVCVYDTILSSLVGSNDDCKNKYNFYPNFPKPVPFSRP